MNKLLTSLIAGAVFTLNGCSAETETVQERGLTSTAPKNIIMVVGDGMGPGHTTAYRYFADDPDTPEIELTIFDELLTGMSSTYPDDDTLVTDSAASATALATGVKSYNGAIGLDAQKQPVETVLERAKALGKNTAIVVTSQINHATPASYIAHNESRQNYNEIADNYFSNQMNGMPVIDLMLGGGTDYFIREDRHLVDEFKSHGYEYVDSLENLDSLSRLPAMGLFAPTGLPYAIDDPEHHDRLTQMTSKALALLSDNNPDGFFLLVEGSQIDWCAHANDIACDMAEMQDFASTIEVIKAFADQSGDTLIVITADHNTGGFSIGAEDAYAWKPDVVRQIHTSISALAELMSEAENLEELWNAHVDFSLSEDEANQLDAAREISTDAIDLQLQEIINARTVSGWTTHGHTGVDVQVFAHGTGSEHFTGHMDNIDIGKKIFSLLR